MQKRLLFLTLYNESGASSRYSVYQFIGAFERAGFTVAARPLLTGNAYRYFGALANTKSPWRLLPVLIEMALAHWRRIGHVIEAWRYDVVVVQKDVLPFGLRPLLALGQKNIVYTFDDPIWLGHPGAAGDVRFLGKFIAAYRGRLLRRLLSVSRLAIVENVKIQEYTRQFCRRVEVLNAAIDLAAYPTEKVKTDTLSFGWVGSPSTLYLLQELLPSLEKLAEEFSFCLYNLSSTTITSKAFKIHNIDWTAENEAAALQKIDIGLQAIDEQPFNQFRYSRKWIVYATLGIPTLATDSPLTRNVIRDGESALLFQSPTDFVVKARELLANATTRARVGQNARRLLEREYDLPVVTKRYIELVESTLSPIENSGDLTTRRAASS